MKKIIIIIIALAVYAASAALLCSKQGASELWLSLMGIAEVVTFLVIGKTRK